MSRTPRTSDTPQNLTVPSSPAIPLQDLEHHEYDENGRPVRTGGPAARQTHTGLPPVTTYWDASNTPPRAGQGQADVSPVSPLDVAGLQFALPPDIRPPGADFLHGGTSGPSPYTRASSYYDDTAHVDLDESDSAPLTRTAQPISGSLAAPDTDTHPRNSFQTVSDLGNSPGRPRSSNMLGFDLEPGSESRHRSFLSPGDNRASRAAVTADAIFRAGSIVRAMSQRVVNISGEQETFEERDRRARSRSPSADGRRPSATSVQMETDTSYQSQYPPKSPIEKRKPSWVSEEAPLPPPRRGPMANPLKGQSLGVFGPENPIRKKLCDLLVNPLTEPLILVLIVVQAVLLAVESANNVFLPGNERPPRWDPTSGFNWAILALFIIFTLEIIARIIVSGFILNAAEYSSIDRQKGVRAIIADYYNAYFRPDKQKPVKAPVQQDNFGPSTFARSFTMMHGREIPETLEEAQRMQLARRAFLRHGFNRLDFIAVVSYWITFVLSITGLEVAHHIFIFRMLSCLRIVRLLALTSGTLIILQSLKKAAPLLVRVAFLIGFFWLLFAIVGVQSFKSSLRRTCVWVDPSNPNDVASSYTNGEGFCGGYLNNVTLEPMPWVKSNSPLPLQTFDNLVAGTNKGKGFLCPRGSICLEQESPHNNTVSFDDILHSIELVFVVNSANTWSDLMYMVIASDFPPAALFFGAGILIMMLWLTNLMIAVITSSFQVIREENKTSAFTATEEPLIPMPQELPDEKMSALKKVYEKTSIFWVIIIVVDLLAQAFRSARMDGARAAAIDNIEIVATILLDIEIIIRFVADWRGFHRYKANLFDLLLAVVTTVILLPPIRNSGVPYEWLTVFQVLRIYRVVLAVPITRNMILQVLGNASGIANLILFVCLICFIMSVFASQLFRGEIPLFDDDGELIRISFYNIFNSFLGIYQILSSENWTDILYSVTAQTTVLGTAWYSAIFFIGWFIFSWFIIINMFIAVIQENFDVSEDEKRLEQVKAFLQRKELGSSSNLALSEIFSFKKRRQKRDPLDYGPATMEMLLNNSIVREFLDEQMGPAQGDDDAHHDTQSPGTPGRAGGSNFFSVQWNKLKKKISNREPNPFYTNLRFDTSKDGVDPREMARQVMNAAQTRRKTQREYLRKYPTYNTTLYLFKPSNPIRRACQRLVGIGRGSERFDGVEPNKIAWYTFSAFIYAAIVAMVVLACVTTPLYQKIYWQTHPFEPSNWFVWIDTAFAVLFTVEAIIKMIADGVLFTPNAYYRSSWGIIDGIVLITLWVNVITLFTNNGTSTRVVGAVKALRALRLLNISNTARDTFHSLIIVAGWKIISAALVSMALLIPFAIYAVTLFRGQLVSCNDGSVDVLNACFGEFESTPFSSDWPFPAPRVAANPFFDFDDFGSALFILFQIVSQEGWVDVSFAVQSITGRNLQPQDMSVPGNAVFFVVFNLMSTVFILTLFISVFMRNYTEQTGVAFLTADQRSWLELRKQLKQISPSKSSYDDSKRKWKKWCHKRAIEKRGKWYTTVTVVLVLHLILLMLEYYPEPDWWTLTRDGIFLVFTCIYIGNISVRIIGLGWARFRKSSWDIFSLLAVGGAFVTTSLLVLRNQVQAVDQLHKFFLVSVVLLLIPRNDALDQLFKTAAASLTTIVNLLATWLVIFLVFAIALTQSFSLTRFAGEESFYVNFRTVPNALLLLFRMSVGEGWNQVMEDYASLEPPFCVDSSVFADTDCGSIGWARTLFIAWNLISMYIFVNLFISLIYESFSYVYQRSNTLVHLSRDDIRRFKEAWRSVDPAGSGYISKEAFPRLLSELSGVFEMRVYDPDDSVGRILDDVRDERPISRHSSIVTTSALTGVNLEKLNDRLNQIDRRQVQERRRRFRMFYEEVMVSADIDNGISFSDVLMILAHYNLINESKSLRLEEFLRRRARMQRVEEELRRRTVQGFFHTVYWSRQFKKHIEKKRAARMTAIPQLDVPDILVDDEEDRKRGPTQAQRATMGGPLTASDMPPAFLAAADALRGPHQSWAPGTDMSSVPSSSSHPLSLPRSPPSMPRHQSQNSAFSFEIQDSTSTTGAAGGGGGSAPGSASGSAHNSRHNSRHNSTADASQVPQLLDDSIWVESIRRGATVRKSQRRSDWGAFR
ncbi:Ion transport protein-domain-containing protein [Microdochium trichocladiopsis]|uniref:Calcium-channel protein CCH1 n=1 Tax=Microdochium trichocladiopsis TaxID=1682393 RepID=A0A9P8Y0Z5_9PEZI|nr:Ion transport protein-domain-containing protein [Microdochium trichocladiopsis]KAH7026510.1 Ion transport protein-domain-containing protein [Microdochium trichocladiopsis]